MGEVDEIKRRYKNRSGRIDYASTAVQLYDQYIREERWGVMRDLLLEYKMPDVKTKALEIGAGTGGNIPLFLGLGIMPDRIYANELLDDRQEELRKKFPSINVIAGNALDIKSEEGFGIILQSTVFTSILDQEFRQKLAKHMLSLLKADGCILWYDFVYNNPFNKDVRKVSRSEIRSLFPDCSVEFERVTLAPPIGRRVGRLYKFLNLLLPFLRTHVVAIIKPMNNF